MDVCFNIDIATEILSRLSPEALVCLKCISKSWNIMISSKPFMRAHSARYKYPSAFFFQDKDYNLYFNEDLIEPQWSITNMLDFLPEKVVIMGSCSGLICCRNRIRSQIYVCNPYSKQFIVVRPNRSYVNDATAFCFYPFGSSSLNSNPCFKLVSVHRSKNKPNIYSFVVYTSETKRWKTSKAFCDCSFRIRKNEVIFVGGVFHWLTYEYHLITFDVERELSSVIKLPGTNGVDENKIGLGVSKGFLAYVNIDSSYIRLWVLKNHDKSKWSLEAKVNVVDCLRLNMRKYGGDEPYIKEIFADERIPICLSFQVCEDVIVFTNYRKSESSTTMLPYSFCLASIGVLEEQFKLCGKRRSNGEGRSSIKTCKEQFESKRKRSSNGEIIPTLWRKPNGEGRSMLKGRYK